MMSLYNVIGTKTKPEKEKLWNIMLCRTSSFYSLKIKAPKKIIIKHYYLIRPQIKLDETISN